MTVEVFPSALQTWENRSQEEKITQEAKLGQGVELFWKQQKDMVGGGVESYGVGRVPPRSRARAGHGRAGSGQVGAGPAAQRRAPPELRVFFVPLSSFSSRATKKSSVS